MTAWTRLRREAPVAYCEPPGMLPFWAIVRHDDIVRISRDPEHFQNAPRLAVFPEEQFATDNFPLRHLLNMDPPDHRHYRHLLSGHFTPRAVEAKRVAVERLVDEILDEVAGRTEIDFVTDVAAVMPIAVIAEMLGLPPEDRPLFFRWTNETLGRHGPRISRRDDGRRDRGSRAASAEGLLHAHGRDAAAQADGRLHRNSRQREARRCVDPRLRAALVSDPARRRRQ